jgi:hypothetical protein
MIPLLASAGAKLLPLITKLASGPLGGLVSKFAPHVTKLFSSVTTAFPQLAGLGGKVAAFAAKNPIMTNIASMFLPGQPITSLGAFALSQPAALAAVKGAWLKGAGAAVA